MSAISAKVFAVRIGAVSLRLTHGLGPIVDPDRLAVGTSESARADVGRKSAVPEKCMVGAARNGNALADQAVVRYNERLAVRTHRAEIRDAILWWLCYCSDCEQTAGRYRNHEAEPATNVIFFFLPRTAACHA
jgi:hypothetical protein